MLLYYFSTFSIFKCYLESKRGQSSFENFLPSTSILQDNNNHGILYINRNNTFKYLVTMCKQW